MSNSKTISMVFAVAVLGLIALSIPPEQHETITACTMDALMCPDGSYVGRSGPSCAFTACPNQQDFTGKLVQNSEGFRLIIAAPEESPHSATYAIPLTIETTNVLRSFANQEVRVEGSFTAGNTLAVRLIEKHGSGAQAPGINEAEISVNQTKLVGGIKITLHEVLQDNRCPIDVQCIEAGAITARVTFVSDTEKETFNMPSDEAPRGFDAWQASIVNVNPPAISTRSIHSSDYRVTFRVEALTGKR
jgi:hypothetical protein